MQQVTTKIGMPLAEFIRLYDVEGPFELINGERIPRLPNVAGHSEVIEILFLAIYLFTTGKSLGKIIRETTFVLSHTSNWVTGSRVPDLMFYVAERINAYYEATPDWKDKPYILTPNLAVEVVSPTDNLADLDDKANLYLADGVGCVWIVDPQKRRVSIQILKSLEPFTKEETYLKDADILKGGDIIPGFEIAVAKLFE
jgi:Uma2 family endonuclease